MVEKAAGEDRFHWRLPLLAAVGAFIIFLPLVTFSANWGEILYLFVAVPLGSIVLVILTIRRKGRQRLSVLLMLVVFWAVSAALVGNHYAVRDTARWLL